MAQSGSHSSLAGTRRTETLPEAVVLVDDEGRNIGTHPKATVHTTRTPLHLAFSCYVFNGKDEVLITERAHHKVTWPAVTTNTCCGHPAPGEPLGDAVVRRLKQELCIDVAGPRLLLPNFRYRAEMSNGIVENELCPVYAVMYDGPQPKPNPDEVARADWVPWQRFSRFVTDGGSVSPWCREQVAQLVELGDTPGRWLAGDPNSLPLAAQI